MTGEGRPAEAAPLRPSPLVTGDRRSRRVPLSADWSRSLSRPPEAERCFLCHSPTLRPWITDRWLRTCAVVDVLRGGALEPEPRALSLEKRRLKQTLIASVYFQHNAEGLSLSGGASIRSRACSS